MYDGFSKNNNDEAVIKIVGKLCLEFKDLEEDLEKQLKIRNVLEGVLYNYDVMTKETGLITSDIEDKMKMYLAVKKLDGLSKKTLYNYNLNLIKFASFLNRPINSITTNDIRVYLAYTCKDKKASSTNTQISILKSFFAWLLNEEYIIKNPMAKIKQTKTPKRLRNALNQEEVELLRQACKTHREKALFEFLISTGCRLSELVGVNKEDLNYVDMSLYVIGKGNKQRKVYFDTKAKLLILRYLETRKDTSEALFVASKKPYKRLGGRSVEREIDKIAVRAGFDKSIYPHIFRHTFATSKLNSGMSLPVLQHLMGHEEPSTTMVYSRLLEENILHEYKKTC